MDTSGPLHVKHAADGSPTLFASTAKPIQGGTDIRRPRTSQTVSIGWEEGDAISRIHAVAECVETKTVTTTTTTKRLYPPILVPQQPLASLDSKEYPLAHKEIPDQLKNFSFETENCYENIQPRNVSSATPNHWPLLIITYRFSSYHPRIVPKHTPKTANKRLVLLKLKRLQANPAACLRSNL